MVRFIFTCMVFMIVSFVAVPVFTGISGERAGRVEASAVAPAIKDETGAGLTFEEIYALVDAYEQDDIASILNDIEPTGDNSQIVDLIVAAEEEGLIPEGRFTHGFSGKLHPAL